MIAVDTSVVVAAFASWHEGHRSAGAALARRPRFPAQVVMETYSVLTRLPPPHRSPSDVVLAFLAARLVEHPLTLPGPEHLRLIREVSRYGIAGGAIYDALVAATAKRAGATLLTRDRRALPVYELIGVEVEFIE